jgi:spermidine/putrescine transport system permease protein
MTTAVAVQQPAAAGVKVHKSRPAPLEYGRKRWLQIILVVSFVFLYFPIFALIAFSFNNSKRNVTWEGFTFFYYVKAFNNSALHDALTNSLIVAFWSTVISTIIGAMLGLALYRYRFPAKGPFEGLIHLPIVIPEICMAVAMLAFFAFVDRQIFAWLNDNIIASINDSLGTSFSLQLGLGLFTITVSHIAFSFPFVAVVVRSRMAGFDESLEEASRDLGASASQTFWNVTLPYMMPGVIAGALLAFTLSLDDFLITFFTSGPASTTFPVKIYSMVRQSVTPEVNAASTVLIVVTLTMTALGMWLQSRSGKKQIGHG